MKNLCLYLMTMAALLCIIVTTNVLAMEKTKQDDLRHQFENILTEINKFLFNGFVVHVIRELAVTIFNLFKPIIFLAIGVGLAWNWWFSFSNAKNSHLINSLPPTNSPPPSLPQQRPHHDHNLREKRQKHFI